MIWVSSLDYFSTEALTISASVSMILIKIWYLLKSTLNYLQLKNKQTLFKRHELHDWQCYLMSGFIRFSRELKGTIEACASEN